MLTTVAASLLAVFTEMYDVPRASSQLQFSIMVKLGAQMSIAGGVDCALDWGASIGCERVVAFHLNDSKTLLGSRVDRHAHIGKGDIGFPAFCCVLRDPRWRKLPMVLETPKSDDLHEDVENLRALKKLF